MSARNEERRAQQRRADVSANGRVWCRGRRRRGVPGGSECTPHHLEGASEEERRPEGVSPNELASVSSERNNVSMDKDWGDAVISNTDVQCAADQIYCCHRRRDEVKALHRVQKCACQRSHCERGPASRDLEETKNMQRTRCAMRRRIWRAQ